MKEYFRCDLKASAKLGTDVTFHTYGTILCSSMYDILLCIY